MTNYCRSCGCEITVTPLITYDNRCFCSENCRFNYELWRRKNEWFVNHLTLDEWDYFADELSSLLNLRIPFKRFTRTTNKGE